VTTDGYAGRIEKTARIYSNDPVRGEGFFKITAHVRVPIHLSTYYVLLSGVENREVSRTVEIRAELDRPLVLTPGALNLEEKVRYALEEVEEGRKYLLHFTALPGADRSYQGYLKFTTNYPEKPEFTVRIRGRFKPVS